VETGFTFTAYVNALRLTASVQLLRTSTLSVMEVASHCGFSCLSHFYHLFHAHYGLTPHAMRMQQDVKK
jgi:AraC family transcriptional regulator